MTFVYWIFDDSCTDVRVSGYVGVSKDVHERFKVHVRKGRVPKNSQYVILLESTRSECFAKEFELRPSKGIGWNRAVGGAQGFRIGFSHSESTKSKMRAAKVGYEQSSEHVAKRVAATKGQKRPKQSIAMKGQNNPMFGTKRPQHVVEAIRASSRGKSAPNRQEIYYIGCRRKVNKTTLAKYHKRCFELYPASPYCQSKET